MKIYGLKSCDTCKKAIKALPQAEIRDVRADGVPDAILQAAQQQFGARLVNTRSTTWRGLGEAERRELPLELLRKYPTLMKRPLIVTEGAMYLGWDKTTQAGLGLAT